MDNYKRVKEIADDLRETYGIKVSESFQIASSIHLSECIGEAFGPISKNEPAFLEAIAEALGSVTVRLRGVNIVDALNAIAERIPE